MSLLLRNLFRLHRLMDEVPGDTGGGGGGSMPDLQVDIAAASKEIGDSLGLGGEEDDSGSATPPGDKTPGSSSVADTEKAAADARAKAVAATERATKVTAAKAKLTTAKTDFTGKTDDEILKLAEPPVAAKPRPKAWKQEHDATWTKLPPEAQAYIEQREAEVEAGFRANGDAVTFGKAVKDVITPYEPLLNAQGVTTPVALKYLLNAHYNMSSTDEAVRTDFFASLLKSYKIDPAKLAAAASATAVQETAGEKANRERIEKLENDRRVEVSGRFEALKADTDKEIAAFAADPKHPYFNEVTGEIALLLQDPKMSLADAYERAVYANPVTRAKELTRLQTEADAKAKKEAEEKAAAAEKARGTRIRGEEKERASPDLLGSMEDTMRETYRKVQERSG